MPSAAMIEGALAASGPRRVAVIKHNASSQPSVFGLLPSNSWRIMLVNEMSFIEIRPPR